MKSGKILFLLLLCVALSTLFSAFGILALTGDMNNDITVTSDDAIDLLRHTIAGDKYGISGYGDINRDGYINSDDAIYLLRHTHSPSEYPIDCGTMGHLYANGICRFCDAEQSIGIPPVSVEEGGAVLKIFDAASGSKAITYSAPDDSFLGDSYAVDLSIDQENWYPIDVWSARVAVQTSSNVYDIYTTYFVNFDFSGKVYLRITPKNSGSVELRPAGNATVCSQSNNTTVISIEEACQVSFEVDGDIYGNLQIFANPIEEIDKTDENIIYLSSGLYTAENCDMIEIFAMSVGNEKIDTPVLAVPSGKTLYLSGGAVVQAMITIENCNNSAIKGRGIIDQLLWNRENNIRSSESKPVPKGINIANSKNVTVEGVIVRDSLAYSIYAGNTTGITVDNFKAIAAAQWSDGFDAMSCSDVEIYNSFFRNNDDCIAVYGSRWSNKGDSRNYEIYNCILWADNAHAINIGNHGSNDATAPDTIENIYFHDIDILEVHSINYTGAFRIACGGENIIRDITLENFNVQFSRSDLIRLHIISDSGYFGATVEDITFKNIKFTPNEGQNVGIYLQGLNTERMIKNITFENVFIGDEEISASSSLLYTNSYVSGLNFID